MVASCWICLEEGNDEEGKPLCRDCSCRGESSGFAHLSCIINYAQSMFDKEINAWQNFQGENPRKFKEPWCMCPNCKQDYQNSLSSQLADAFCSYATNYKDNGKIKTFCLLIAKFSKFKTIPMKHNRIAELHAVATNVFSLSKQLAEESSEGYPALCLSAEAEVYAALGIAYANGGGGDTSKAVEYFEKFRESSRKMGNDREVQTAQDLIDEQKVMERRNRGETVIPADKEIQIARVRYEASLANLGENHVSTLAFQVTLAIILSQGCHPIEAERIGLKTQDLHRRVFGPNHAEVKGVERMLAKMRQRQVFIKTIPQKRFVALRYEGVDDEECVLRGPKSTERKCFTKDVVACPGTPVTCIGLKNASHLNGKMGDVRSVDEETGRLAVHFEGKKACLVRRENVRIVFNVPE